MPKAKSHKGILKRMRLTRRGKVMRKRANRGHLMSTKSGNRRRRLHSKTTVKTATAATYVRLMDV